MKDLPLFSKIITFVKTFHVDPTTVVITLVLIPLIRALLKAVRAYVRKWGTYLLGGLLYWLSRFVMHSLAARLTLRQYCAMQLERDNKYVFVPSRFDVKVEIDRVYVTLTLNYQGRHHGTFNHRTLFQAGNRIRIVGDPGSGKSSFAKRIFRDACRESVAEPSEGRLPILVELRNLEIPHRVRDEQLGEWLLKQLRDTVEQTSLYKVADCFDNYSTTTGLLVLLDGLDEVSSARYARVERAINGLSGKLAVLSPQNILVVTMRTQFHQQVREAFRDSLGQVLFIEPFSPTDIFEFLSQWPFDGNAAEMISTIYSELTDRPTLREMCTNPLVLAMYVAERQSGSRTVTPETRTEFYRRVTDELLIRRRLSQLGPGSAPGKLREQRERILGRVAYEHLLDHRQTANSLRWEEALKIVKGVMQCDSSKAEVIFRETAKETGLVAEERPGETFRFIHLTFCEFLAAFESVEGQEDGWERLRDAQKAFRHDRDPQARSRLLEVIPFACGLSPRVRRPARLSEVCGLGDYRLLARCFLETKSYEHSSWGEFLDCTRKGLPTTPESNWDEHWLRDLHLFNVVVSDARQCSEHAPEITGLIDLGDFYSALVSKQQNSLATLLHSYAAQDGAAAFRLADVCGLDLAANFPQVVVSNCDQHPFFALVVQRALHDNSRIGMWAQLLAEAGLRSRLVARTMHDMEPVEELEDAIAKAPIHSSWEIGALLHRSFYLQIMTLAVASQFRVHCQCPLLEVLRRTPAPGRRRLGRILYRNSSLTLGAPVLLGSILSFLLVASGFKFVRLISHFGIPGVIVILLFFFTYYLALRAVGLRMFNYAILNLGSIPTMLSRSPWLRAIALADVRTMVIYPSEARLLRDVRAIRDGVLPGVG